MHLFLRPNYELFLSWGQAIRHSGHMSCTHYSCLSAASPALCVSLEPFCQIHVQIKSQQTLVCPRERQKTVVWRKAASRMTIDPLPPWDFHLLVVILVLYKTSFKELLENLLLFSLRFPVGLPCIHSTQNLIMCESNIDIGLCNINEYVSFPSLSQMATCHACNKTSRHKGVNRDFIATLAKTHSTPGSAGKHKTSQTNSRSNTTTPKTPGKEKTPAHTPR